MIGVTYPSTPYARRLTAANGWHGQLIRDVHGQVEVIVAVRVGPTWTDAVAIAGADRGHRHAPPHERGPADRAA